MAHASDRGDRWLAYSLIPLCILTFLAVRSCINDDQRKKTTWTVVAEGVYEHADYGHFDRTWRSSHGSERHATIDTTIVFFDDGRTCVMEGRIDMPLPKGAHIRILKNGYTAFKVEKAP